MEHGWDPEVKSYFRKILSSVSGTLLWLLTSLTLGLYFGLAYRTDLPLIYVILFYLFFLVTLLLLIRYLYRMWRR
jgi:hypothetical protein